MSPNLPRENADCKACGHVSRFAPRQKEGRCQNSSCKALLIKVKLHWRVRIAIVLNKRLLNLNPSTHTAAHQIILYASTLTIHQTKNHPPPPPGFRPVAFQRHSKLLNDGRLVYVGETKKE